MPKCTDCGEQFENWEDLETHCCEKVGKRLDAWTEAHRDGAPKSERLAAYKNADYDP